MNTTPADDPDAAYCEYLAACSEAVLAGDALDTPADLRPDLRRAGHLLFAVRAAGQLTPSAKPSHPRPLDGLRQVGRFELLKELGRGGAGAVFEARDPTLGRTVALKLLHPALAAQRKWAERFRAEGPALARLRHPNAVQIFEAGEADGVAYLAMELLPGPDLHTKLAAGPLSSRRAAELVAALADAVEHAHAAGLLHRDLKPANVLLDAAGAPKLADFGLAAPLAAAGDAAGTGLTATGEFVGTLNYLAPESLDGLTDRAADVYGLGAVLYECLTGRPPFAASNIALTLMQVRCADPISPRLLNPEVPRDLDTVCLRCLNKRPHERYASAAALAADLRAYLAGRPVTARPPGVAQRAVKWLRRRPATAAVIAAGALATAAGLGGWTQHTRQLAAALATERDALAQRDAALDLAQTRGRTLGNLADTLAAVFADLDPGAAKPGGGAEPLAAVLAARLAAASRAIDGGGGDPLATARVQARLADALHNLGRSAEAVAPARLGAAGLAAALGGDDPEAIAAATVLADSLYRARQFGEATAVRRAALAQAEARFGDSHRVTFSLRTEDAIAAVEGGRAGEAIAPLEELSCAAAAALGPDDPATLAARNALGTAYVNSGDPARALVVFEDVLARLTAVHGPDHLRTLRTDRMVAFTLLDLGRHADAEARAAAVAAAYRRTVGDAHPEALDAAQIRALCLAGLHRSAEAVLLLEDIVRLGRAYLAPGHYTTLVATFRLGVLKIPTHPPTAVALLERAVADGTAAYGPDTEYTRDSAGQLARARDEVDRADQSGRAYAALADAYKRLGITAGRAAAVNAAAGHSLEKAGRPADAEPYRRHNLVLLAQEKATPADLARARAHLGANLLSQVKYADAEPELLAAHAAFAAVPERAADAKAAAGELAKLYERWGRPVDAGLWRAGGPRR